ncbi:hypothetical protein ACH5RR_007868 [Cinchona calisaya]|uniref:RBR-type E3 ubiquitin transferase n=1 Tax=Cinchona calisaya TaxID=153742 RepID=A0ABD3A9Z4_9GENT
MVRRKFEDLYNNDPELKNKSQIDMEVDTKEGENREELALFDDDYLSRISNYNNDDDHRQYSSWQSNLAAEDDDDYALQEAIFYSSRFSSSTITNIEELEDDQDDHEHSPKPFDVKQKGICSSVPLKPHFDEHYNIWRSSSSKESGECSWSECVICCDDKPIGELKQNVDCGHLFCEDCMKIYIGKKIQENGIINIHKKVVKCPEKDCKNELSIQQFRPYIPDEVCDRIGDLQRESNALANPRILECPLLFCCAKFVDDNKGFKIKACPGCWRIFCVECRVKWHMGKSCEQFQDEVRAQALAEERARAKAFILLCNPFLKIWKGTGLN